MQPGRGCSSGSACSRWGGNCPGGGGADPGFLSICASDPASPRAPRVRKCQADVDDVWRGFLHPSLLQALGRPDDDPRLYPVAPPPSRKGAWTSSMPTSPFPTATQPPCSNPLAPSSRHHHPPPRGHRNPPCRGTKLGPLLLAALAGRPASLPFRFAETLVAGRGAMPARSEVVGNGPISPGFPRRPAGGGAPGLPADA